jgi:ADP-ribose pyrophosphatase
VIEKTLSSKLLYKGKFLDFVEHQVEIDVQPPQIASRQFFIHPGGVCVLPILDDNKFVLVKQYRKAIDQILIEIPAGKIDPGETDTLETAKRELLEETGYRANTWINMGELIPCPGYCTEKLYLYFAKDLVPGEQDLDEGEFVEPLIIDCDTAVDMIYDGQIRDSKTVNAIFMSTKYLS